MQRTFENDAGYIFVFFVHSSYKRRLRWAYAACAAYAQRTLQLLLTYLKKARHQAVGQLCSCLQTNLNGHLSLNA